MLLFYVILGLCFLLIFIFFNKIATNFKTELAGVNVGIWCTRRLLLLTVIL